MATVRVVHDIDDLARDLRQIPADTRRNARKVVRGEMRRGTKILKRIASENAGPHGSKFPKRISGEMTGPLEAEFGPSALRGTRYVGVGGDAGVNRDLDKAARAIGPAFGRNIGKAVGAALKANGF